MITAKDLLVLTNSVRLLFDSARRFKASLLESHLLRSFHERTVSWRKGKGFAQLMRFNMSFASLSVGAKNKMADLKEPR